jgi:hypothetical protein
MKKMEEWRLIVQEVEAHPELQRRGEGRKKDGVLDLFMRNLRSDIHIVVSENTLYQEAAPKPVLLSLNTKLGGLSFVPILK